MDNNSFIISIIYLKYSITTNFAWLQHQISSSKENSYVSTLVCVSQLKQFSFYLFMQR